MEKILILGGARFHGYKLALNLSKCFEVFVLNRGNYRTNYPTNITHIKLDRNEENKIENIFKNYKFDIIIDNNGYNIHQIKIIKNAIQKIIVKQYIFISTAAVYRKLFTDFSLQEDQINFKSNELFSPNIYNYAINKLKCEKYIKNNFPSYTNYTIFRFPNIFGIDDFAHKISYYLYRFLSLERVIFEKEIKKFSVIYDEDVVKAISYSILNNKFYNNIFNVSNPECITLSEFFSPIADLYNKKKFFIEASKIWANGYYPIFGWGPCLNVEKFLRCCGDFKFTDINKWLKNCFIQEKKLLMEGKVKFKINDYEIKINNDFNS